MRKIFMLLVLFMPGLFRLPVFAQENPERTDRKLAKKIAELTAGFKGEIGIYVKNLKNGKTVAIDADTLFPTASIVKVPILITIMDKIEKGELNYHQKLIYADTIHYEPAEDIAGYLKPGTPIELSKVMMLMITISDNNASLWLQGLAGTGTVINHLMDSLGYHQTKVNSRTPGREAARNEFGWGQTTPREMGKIFEDIVAGKILSAGASQKMLRILSRQYWDEEALSGIPAGVFAADKNGAVDESRNEVIFVNGKTPYILSIFTKNNKDTSWEPGNAAWVLTRKLSALVWNEYR